MSSPEDAGRLIVLGRVTKPHGIKGEVRVVSYAQSDASFTRLDYVLLRSGKGEVRRFGLLKLRSRSQGLVFKLEGVDDRSSAEELAGMEVVTERRELPDPDEGEYYWVDLIGLEVQALSGQTLGRVENIFETGANDVLVVRGPKAEEILIPALEGVVIEVDLKGGVMKIDMPPSD